MTKYPTILPPHHPTDLNIVFLGTPRFAQIILKKLVSSQFKPQLVITGHDKKVGRGQTSEATGVKLDAEKNHIEISSKLSSINNSFDIAILAAFGQIIPKEILTIPKYGFLNVHPSLLPKYRGPSPIRTPILEGETKTGVTIIKLDKELDHGPILDQKEITIDKLDTLMSLTEKLAKFGADLLIETLPYYLSGKIKPKEQDHAQATYTKRLTKKDGYINLDNPSDPIKLDRLIRAFYPWPGVWSKLMVNGKWLIVKFLPDSPFLIQPEGKRPLTIRQFRNGYPNLYDLIKPILEKNEKLI